MIDLAPHFARMGARLAEVEAALADGAVFGDPAKARQLTREHARLKRAVADHGALRAVERQIEANLALAAAPEQEAEFVQMIEVERADLETKRAALELAVQTAVLPPDPRDDRNVIVEIRAGTGGSEAALFAGDLFRMYSRFIEGCPGWKMETLEASAGEAGGLREVIFQVTGEDVFRRLRFESGVHRVQRVPATEAQGRIHTSTATVAVLPEAEDVEVDLKPEDLRIEVCRASGPGGQGVNTTDSAVQIQHLPTGLIVRCQDGRSQIKNKERALSILRSRLLERRQAEENAKLAAARRSQVGTGDRNEKIRTYNFPQNRITDHRIGLTLYDLAGFMEGGISGMLDALAARDVEERLAALG